MSLNVENVLDEKVSINFGKSITLREYIFCVFADLWADSEGFSGYRPFGSSDWEFEDICDPIAARHGLESEMVRDLIKDALHELSPFK